MHFGGYLLLWMRTDDRKRQRTITKTWLPSIFFFPVLCLIYMTGQKTQNFIVEYQLGLPDMTRTKSTTESEKPRREPAAESSASGRPHEAAQNPILHTDRQEQEARDASPGKRGRRVICARVVQTSWMTLAWRVYKDSGSVATSWLPEPHRYIINSRNSYFNSDVQGWESELQNREDSKRFPRKIRGFERIYPVATDGKCRYLAAKV